MTANPNSQFFNIYDKSGALRGAVDQAAKKREISRSALIRDAVNRYLNQEG